MEEKIKAAGAGVPPVVSIVLPCRNEADFIGACLDSVSANDYGGGFELLVVDGMSTDGTRGIVAEHAGRRPYIRLLDNPKGIVPTAMNIGIRAASGGIIIRMDAHTQYGPDYISRCVEYLEKTGADNVGGAMRVAAESPFEEAVALATGSVFGVGNARFHFEDYEGYVDTVYLGAYKRDVFERVGYFDEGLVRNQDDELNYRLLKAGGKIYMARAIVSRYHPRTGVGKLWRQYFQYGYYKVKVIAKHGMPASPRHLAPGAFVLSLVALPLLGILSRPLLWLSVLLPGLYLALAAYFAARASAGGGPLLMARVMTVFVVLHTGYGSGFLKGVMDMAAAPGDARVSGGAQAG